MSTILILTNTKDGMNSEIVIDHIKNSGNSVIRLDVDKITSGENNFNWYYCGGKSTPILESQAKAHDLSIVDAIWFRRPYVFDFEINDPIQREVAEEEVRDILDGLFAALEDKFWVSNPVSINRARLKPYQIHIARDFGLVVPETLITNSPEAAREFCQRKTVFKPMAGYHFDYQDETRTAYTTIISERHLEQLDLVRSQPVLLQRWIPKQFEVRATFVGNKLFTAKLELDNFEEIADWRLPAYSELVAYENFALPKDIEMAARKLLKRLGLQYAALDFAVDTEGRYFFLEINPIGQWLWIENETGLPISLAIATLLVGKDTV